MKPVLLTSAYLPPIHYFSKLYSAPDVYLEGYDHYVKQTYRNRCVIAGPEGPLALTLPVVHADKGGKTCTRDIRLSDHGNWPHLHCHALQSAYEKTAYFDYYCDDLLPLYERKWTFLMDFNTALTDCILSLLDLHPRLQLTTAYRDASAYEAEDFRETIRPKTAYSFDHSFRPKTYYQVFASRNGFLPNLSIVDLLFNMGPESRLILRDSTIL